MDNITLKEIIDYARINEENSRRFYAEAAEHAKKENVRGFLRKLAKDEEKHIAHLNELENKVEAGSPLPKGLGVSKPLGYADYLGKVTLDENANYQDVLKAAMAKEKEAMDSYRKYSSLVSDPKARELFLLLADEEAAHLRVFEEKYDDFMKEIENW